MSGFENLKRRMSMSGANPRDEIIKDAVRMERRVNESDPSYCSTFFYWNNGKCPQPGKQIHPRFYSRKWSAVNGHSMMMKTLIDEPVKCGDTFYNSKDDTWWICTETDCIDDIDHVSKLIESNYCLKFQNDDLDILEYRCLDQNATQYNSGVKTDDYMRLTSAQHMLTLPKVKDITSLKHDKRFFLTEDYESSPFVYKLTQNDMTSSKGLCKIMLTQSEKDEERDNIVIGICDYIDPLTVKPDEPGNPGGILGKPLSCKISYKGEPVLKMGGNKKSFTGSFLDDELIPANKVGMWDVVTIDELEPHITYEIDGNTIKIKVADVELAIGSTVRIIFSDNEKTTSSYLDLKITGSF